MSFIFAYMCIFTFSHACREDDGTDSITDEEEGEAGQNLEGALVSKREASGSRGGRGGRGGRGRASNTRVRGGGEGGSASGGGGPSGTRSVPACGGGLDSGPAVVGRKKRSQSVPPAKEPQPPSEPKPRDHVVERVALPGDKFANPDLVFPGHINFYEQLAKNVDPVFHVMFKPEPDLTAVDKFQLIALKDDNPAFMGLIKGMADGLFEAATAKYVEEMGRYAKDKKAWDDAQAATQAQLEQEGTAKRQKQDGGKHAGPGPSSGEGSGAGDMTGPILRDAMQ